MLSNQENNASKEVVVRTMRGRSKSICVPTEQASNNFPIGRLNNYDKGLKKYKGPLSMVSELESICERERSMAVDQESLKGSIENTDSINSYLEDPAFEGDQQN